MYELSVFRCLLHNIMEGCKHRGLHGHFGSCHHLRLIYLGMQELRNVPGLLSPYSDSLPAELKKNKMRIF
jgi:hypothetical protein